MTIKLVVSDFDGVFTDGKVFYNDNGKKFKYYNVRDGAGLGMLKKNGIKIGLISGNNTIATIHIAKHLKFDKISIGKNNKLDIIKKWIEEYNLKWEEVCYIGDDVVDIPVLKNVGLPICPADAIPNVKSLVKFITKTKGGNGVIREVAEHILKEYYDINYVDQYLSNNVK